MLQENAFPDTWPGHAIYRTLLEQFGSSGLLLAAFTLCAAVAGIAILRIWRDLRKTTPTGCPWKKDGTPADGAMTRWICANCKSISFNDGSAPPLTCRAFEPRSKSL